MLSGQDAIILLVAITVGIVIGELLSERLLAPPLEVEGVREEVFFRDAVRDYLDNYR